MRPEHRQLLDELRSARRVLVVDDHPSFRRCARRLLTEEGFEVVGEAEDGATALALADELAPDLVLLDIQLPDVDGFEVASRLLELEPGLPIVLVSSRDHDAYGARIEASGARGFVAKADLSGAALERLLE
jgi:DNA-binding NarL/FixJ family response regulator